MSSYFANKHYNIAWLESELEYLLDNPELSHETKEQIQRTIDQLELCFSKLEDIDKIMTFRMTEEAFLNKYKKIRI
jgi:hypothetical protein